MRKILWEFLLKREIALIKAGVITYLVTGGGENFILKLNLDPFDEEPVEQDFSDFSVLLYINATTRSSDIERAIRDGGGFELLRHEVF